MCAELACPPTVLLPELDWDLEGTCSPVTMHTPASTPPFGNTAYDMFTVPQEHLPGSRLIGPPRTSTKPFPAAAIA